MPAELPPEKRKHPIPRVQRYYMVVIFTLTASLLFADQNLLAPNLTMIAQEFNMNAIERDRQGPCLHPLMLLR